MRENHLKFTQTEHRAIPSIKALLYKYKVCNTCVPLCVLEKLLGDVFTFILHEDPGAANVFETSPNMNSSLNSLLFG